MALTALTVRGRNLSVIAGKELTFIASIGFIIANGIVVFL